MDFQALWPFINNAGASVLFIVFLFLNHKRTEMDHVRTMQRDNAAEETIRTLMIALMECTKSAMVQSDDK